MRKLVCATIISGAFLAGYGLDKRFGTVNADPLLLPSWVSSGACFRASGTSGTVEAVEGSWVRLKSAGEETWVNLGASQTIVRVRGRECRP